MIKYYIQTTIMLLLCIASLQVKAQDQYGLEDCKRIAIENNRKLKNSRLEIQAAQQLEKEAFTNYFPSISASGTGILPKDPLVSMSLAGMSLGVLDKGFQTGITVTQPIFAGGKIITGNKLADLGTEVSRFQAKLSENEVLLNTESLYWQLLSLYEKEHTLDIVDTQLDTLLRDVELSYKAGLITHNDVLKVKLKKNEVKSARINLENGIKLVKMSLCQQMGIDLAEADQFKINIPDIENVESPMNYYVDHKSVLADRMESKLLDKNIEVTKLQTKMKRGDYLPTVAFGASYYGENIVDKWRSNGIVFASVSIPLSGWWGGSHAIKRQRIQEQIALNNKIDTEEQLLLQMQNVKNELDNAYKQILLAKDGVEQSTENLRLNTNYYKVGTVTLTDVLDAQTLLQQNRDKYVESYTDYQKKRIEYLQVTGR
ncbi:MULTISPECIES: TolC family protein [unclassified Dysgonomonas]|uniref:TolC family protein n=1 Tax=unclassified Dysgonomonas TaxID=2630389 RepID=UPI0025BA7878|nr:MULTISPECIES: TolC family protein [unclassified Dysgonomonas]MDR2002558.1 TolC family protein [Prevotella sp.]HMM01927.1 TolC family protein [Dysgonomonas sp.]